MARRTIKRKRGEGISITGPATVHVSRRVTLVIEAAREARVERLAKQRQVSRGPAGKAEMDQRPLQRQVAGSAGDPGG